MLLWPFTNTRFGWPVLVPLYRLLADSPFSLRGAALFTLLEILLAWPLWMLGQTLVRSCLGIWGSRSG